MDVSGDDGLSLEVARDFFRAVPNGEVRYLRCLPTVHTDGPARAQFTATLVSLKKKVRQLVRFVTDLGTGPCTKTAIDHLWRMIAFLATYVSSLDDPSGEMRVVVRDIKVSVRG
jgi:hypothetical protein